jgi:hypothetical protein
MRTGLSRRKLKRSCGVKNIETAMTTASAGVGKLVAAFLGLTAVFTGGKQVGKFMEDVTRSDASIGRFANNLRMSAKDLQSWQGAVESVGGAAADVTASVQGLSDSFQALKTFGDPGIVKALAVIGTKGGKRIDINKPINSTLLDLADDLSKMAKTDPAQASFLGRQIGLNQNLINVLIKGRAETEKLLSIQAKYAASTADIDAAEKRQSAWQRLQAAGESFGRTILTAVTPALLKMNELLQQFVEWAKSQLPALQKAFEETFGSFDEILRNIANTLKDIDWKTFGDGVKAFGGDLKGAAEWVNSLVKGTVGWKVALELLLGLAVLKWLSPIVSAFGLIASSIATIVGFGPALAALFATAGGAWLLNKITPDKSPPGYPDNPVAPDNPARPNHYRHGESVHQRALREHGAAAGSGGGDTPDPEMMKQIDRVSAGDPELHKKLLGMYAGESAHIPGHYDLGDYSNGKPTSFGPLQFHRGGPGSIGTDFERETGKNLEDQSTIPDQFDYAAKWLKSHPNADIGKVWHGYADRGKAMVERGWGSQVSNQSQGGPLSGSATPHPRRYQGQMKIGDETFDYASGSGRMGRGSSPFGSHPITGFDPSALHGRGGGAFRTRDVYDPQVHD